MSASAATPGAPPAGYRPGVGIVLFNAEGLVFAGRRSDVGGEAWQLPQGGIDAGESPRAAALRELAEETGTGRAAIIAETEGWLVYDLPEPLRGRWHGRYRGQAQQWFLARFTGTDADIDIGTGGHAEFDAWRWMALTELARGIVGFKRGVYDALVEAFAERIEAEASTRNHN